MKKCSGTLHRLQGMELEALALIQTPTAPIKWKLLYICMGLYRGDGKENLKVIYIYIYILGLYRDNGKQNLSSELSSCFYSMNFLADGPANLQR